MSPGWWRKQTIDQATHFAAAAAVVLCAALTGHPAFAGGWIGLSLGFVREVTEGRRIGAGSRLDLIFWTLGGAVAGWLVS